MHSKRIALLAAAAAYLASATPAQPDAALRLWEPWFLGKVQLVDPNGRIVHEWTRTMHAHAIHLAPDGSLLRTVRDPFGPPPPITNSNHHGLRRYLYDGTIVWDYRHPTGTHTHHSLEPLPNGNVLMVAWDVKTHAEAVAAGRHPEYTNAQFLVCSVIEIQQTGPRTGQVVWQWKLWDHLIQDLNAARSNFGVVANHPELLDINFPPQKRTEWNHCNGIHYDPEHDLIYLSFPAQHEVYAIDHSTTTAEAAGHTGGRRGTGGDFLYRWGNPLAYRQGTAADQQLFTQHSPRIVPLGFPGAGHLTVFNNDYVKGQQSAVFELALPIDAQGDFTLAPSGRYGPLAPSWVYTSPGLYSGVMSSAERMRNGNTLICSSDQDWMLEVTPSGQKVWEHFGPGGRMFHAHVVERELWSTTDTLPASGGSVDFDLMTGTVGAGAPYFLLPSGAGTAPGLTLSGVHVPLNVDPFMLLGLQHPNAAPVFANTFGTLDALGHARASFVLPASTLPAGLRLDFAFAWFDPVGQGIRGASHAVPLSVF